MNFSLELKNTAYTTDQLPVYEEPQIAFVGRSNVGKSSLLNALAGRKKLAKVSANPGKTRSVNFYFVNPWNFYLVDLPGYGYARASHEERRKWATVLENYLLNTKELRGMALLLDCRLPPQQIDIDLSVFAMNANIPVLPVLTKTDKCKQSEKSRREQEWQNILGKKPLAVSAQRHSGLDKLWRALILMATGKVVEERIIDHP